MFVFLFTLILINQILQNNKPRAGWYLMFEFGTWCGSGCYGRRWSCYGKQFSDGWFAIWWSELSADSSDRSKAMRTCSRSARRCTSNCTAPCHVATLKRTSTVVTSKILR